MVGFINKKYFDDQMVEKYPFYLVLNRSVIFCDTVHYRIAVYSLQLISWLFADNLQISC